MISPRTAFPPSTSSRGTNAPPAPLEAQHLLSPAGGAAGPDKTATAASPLFSRSFSTSSSHHSLQIGSPQPGAAQQALKTAERRVSARLLPPLLLLVIISYLDRTALAFASIQMSRELSLSSTVYGLGSGAFFLAYALGQIPSNFLLLRFGAPAWLAAICVAWGVAAGCMALVRGPVSFVLIRMVLGLAESGAFPGVWYYISCWYAPDRTTLPYSIIETGITVSQVVAAPAAAGLLLLDGKLGLAGFQWIFIVEGLPAVLLGCFIGFLLPASIQTATFLSEQQRAALLAAAGMASSAAAPEGCTPPGCVPPSDTDSVVDASVAVEPEGCCKSESEVAQLLHRGKAGDSQAVADSAGGSRLASPVRPSSAAGRGCVSSSVVCDKPQGGSSDAPTWRSVVAVARNRVVLYAGSWRILHDIPGNGVLYFTPKIVQALLLAGAAGAAAGSSRAGAGVVLLSAIPYAAASLAHLANALHSQRVGEVTLHICISWLLGAVALVALPFAASGALSGVGGSSSSSSMAASVASFVLLAVAHVGVNGANGLQTGLVAGCLPAEHKALGLATYNTIACLGSFLGPLLIGVLHDATGGYSAAMWLVGCSLAAAACMVYRFQGASRV